ncbi:MAG: GGDEF domain-containing protein [Magnetococcales bacterium]|nr:GGDEF domain-containing protein [Magnetococcales bacterium]
MSRPYPGKENSSSGEEGEETGIGIGMPAFPENQTVNGAKTVHITADGSVNKALPLTRRNLSDQMKMTDREVEERKRLLGFADADVAFLKGCKEHIARRIDIIIENFYSHQESIQEVELLIGDAETLKRLKASLRGYIIELFDGYYDREYVNKRLRIGKVHKRIGVSPKLYISAVVLLEDLLQQELLEVSMNDRVCTDCDGRRQALHKLLMFDIQLVFDTYISSLLSEVRAASDQVERYAQGLEATVAERTRQLEELSSMDGLTGLLNQRTFFNILRREINRAEENRQPLSLVYFDLNKFKQLNDTQGHKAGDALLTLVGEVCKKSIRDYDTAFRYGGDEFGIVMPETTQERAIEICQQLIETFDKGRTFNVTFSIGIAQMGPDDYYDMDNFIKQADSFMYVAKAQSKKEPGHYIRYKGAPDEEPAEPEAF